MFCAVKAIDREGGTRSVVFNTHLTFTWGKFRSLAGQLSPNSQYEVLTNFY